MEQYRKGIVAGVMFLAFIAKTYFDLDLSDQTDNLIDIALAGMTVAGVYWIPNAEKKTI